VSRRRLAALTGLSVVAAILAGSPAHAVSRAGCAAGTTLGSTTISRAPDSTTYTPAQLRVLQRQLRARLLERSRSHPADAASSMSARVGPVLRVPVHVHVIGGTHSAGVSRKRVLRQLTVLNAAYDGGQSADNSPTHFAFYLASFQRVRNDSWRYATIGSQAERTMRRRLHIGGRQDLNVYIAKPPAPAPGQVLLGFSTEPWQYSGHPKQDGVTLNEGSLPGGRLKGYNLGDTAVHEIGHWLGMLHPFDGRCTEPNDGVADTPEEAKPSYSCDETKNTCASPGLDPVHNFMDYAPDACMDMFTPDQATRMTDEWLAYRAP